MQVHITPSALKVINLQINQDMHNDGYLQTAYYLNYLLKYYEFIDTILLVLKKKPIQFLHFYHHASNKRSFIFSDASFDIYPTFSSQYSAMGTNIDQPICKKLNYSIDPYYNVLLLFNISLRSKGYLVEEVFDNYSNYSIYN